MKILFTLVLSAIVVYTASQVLDVHLTEQARIASAERYQKQKTEHDKRMSEACAKGQTGVVLYYKGVDCGANK